MTLNSQSLRGAVRRKAQLARQKVRAAEEELDAANTALKRAIPRHDVTAIAQAAERTARAEDEVHEAAEDLDVVDQLLDDGGTRPSAGGASGEGARSLLPFLGRSPKG